MTQVLFSAAVCAAVLATAAQGQPQTPPVPTCPETHYECGPGICCPK